jgi:hypothetical protein
VCADATPESSHHQAALATTAAATARVAARVPPAGIRWGNTMARRPAALTVHHRTSCMAANLAPATGPVNP